MSTETKQESTDIRLVKKQFKGDIVVTAVVSAVLVGIAALAFLVFVPMFLKSENYTMVVVITFLGVFLAFPVGGTAIGFYQASKSRDAESAITYKRVCCTIQLVMLIVALAAAVICVIAPFVDMFVDMPGFKKGDYSEYSCAECKNPADGGLWKKATTNDTYYYCEKHFEQKKEEYKRAGNKDSYGHTAGDVYVIAQDEVESRLKSPSTAKFSSIGETNITVSDDTWTVSGWVDAQNSFGATLRQNFTVTVRFTDETHYTVSCSISE